MSQPIIIEFIGLPGTGKSTLCKKVCMCLQNQKYPVSQPTFNIEHYSTFNRIVTKLKFVIKSLISHPHTIPMVIGEIIIKNRQTATDTIRVLFNLSYIDGIIADYRTPEGVCLLDQGPYQGVWSVGLNADEAWSSVFDRFSKYLRQNTPDLIVCVDAKPEIVASRLANRSGGDTRLSADSSQFNRAVEGYKQLKNQLTTADCQTITVTNENKEMIKPNVIQIVDKIQSLSAQ